MTGGILIDLSAAVNQRAGIGRYARELTRELLPQMDADQVRLWYAADEPLAAPESLQQAPWNAFPVAKSRLSRRNVDRLIMRAQLPLRWMTGPGQVSVSYSPDFTTPRGGAEVVTVHDLAWLHPEAHTNPKLAEFLAPVVEREIARANTIFTVSETVRDELRERFALHDDRVLVAPNAAAASFFSAEPLDDATLEDLGIRRPFLMFVGTIEPRKNLATLLESLPMLPRELSLVVAGKDGWGAESQWEAVERLGLQSRVVRLGFVPDQLLGGLYAAASSVVYPSTYEGFGLPVVEALAAGVPVVASDLPVFHEVGGDEIWYACPNDAESLAAAIAAAIAAESNDTIKDRRRHRAQSFSWKASATIVANRLRELA